MAALSRLLEERVDGALRAQPVGGAIQLHVKGATGVLPQVVTAAERGGFTITDLSIAEPSLETVFISLTGKDLRD
jgi:ABC-2 type transport system ATP-binding protein